MMDLEQNYFGSHDDGLDLDGLLAHAEVPVDYIDDRFKKFLSEFVDRERLKDKLDYLLDTAMLMHLARYPFTDFMNTHNLNEMLRELANEASVKQIISEHGLKPNGHDYDSVNQAAKRRLVEIASLLPKDQIDHLGVVISGQDQFSISKAHVLEFLEIVRNMPSIEERVKPRLADYVIACTTLGERLQSTEK